MNVNLEDYANLHTLQNFLSLSLIPLIDFKRNRYPEANNNRDTYASNG